MVPSMPKPPRLPPPDASRQPLRRDILDRGLPGYRAFSNELLWAAYLGEISEVRALRLIQGAKGAAEIWAAEQALMGPLKEK